MKKRISTGICILISTVLLVIFSNYPVYPIVLSLLALRGAFELLRAVGTDKNLIIALPAYVFTTVFPTAAYFVSDNTAVTYALALASLLFVYMLMLMFVSVFSKGKVSFAKTAEIFMSITYISVAFSTLSLLRYLNRETGAFLIALVFIVSWVCDAGAYFIGSLCGKHKLIPEISPKKTVEGAIGGIVIATAAFLVYGMILDYFVEAMTVNYWILFVLGVLLSIVSQLGDLVASLIKREYGVKDYGRLFPGHGGVMDRFDSTISVSTLLMILCAVFPPFTF